MELQEQLSQLETKLASHFEKAAAEESKHGKALDETITSIKSVQTQLDALELKIAQGSPVGREMQSKTFGEMFVESEQYKEAKDRSFVGNRPINVALRSSAFPLDMEYRGRSVKTNITDATIGLQATTSVLMPQRIPGVIGIPQQELRIRDILNVRKLTSGSSFDWVRQTTRTNVASPQIEAAAKSESTYLWDAQIGTIKTIAHYVNVSKQALDDVDFLRNMLDTELTYGLKVKEETEILSGDGTGAHIDGIIHQASAFNTGLLHNTAGWTRIDMLRYAKLQVRLVGLATYAPSAYVLHPTDMAELELTKTTYGQYIIGDPKTGVEVKYLWGLPVVESDSIAQGTFLVGAFNTAATLVDRMAATIDISYEHASNFTSNLATVLCEERIGLAVQRPTAFVTGTLNTSPA